VFSRVRNERRLLGSHYHCVPIKVFRFGRSRQFGRTSAPMIPQLVQTMRGPNAGTGTSSGQASSSSTA